MRLLNFLFLFFLLCACNSATKQTDYFQLKFLDEYVLSNDLIVDSTLVGGLSGLDFYNGVYYLACDNDENPRYYKAKIEIKGYEFDSIEVFDVVELADSKEVLDLESIVFDSINNEILLISEGNIKKGKDPSFFSVNSKGEFINKFEIPPYFKAKGKQEPRHNGVFEGLASSFDKMGYWIATELPLKEDGPEPKFSETTSPVRITYFNNKGVATKQFAYLLDRVGKKPLGNFAVNGVTDLLEYGENKLLIIERSYSSGYENQGNVIKIYSVDYSNAVNTINYNKLTKVNYYPVKKELVFNFEDVRDQLTNKSIDNIEGISFGPTLPNGNRTIILISDNNFDKEGQLNQFILMELVD